MPRYLGDSAMMVGNFSEDRKNYQHALQLSIEAQAILIALDALLGFGDLQTQTGELE